MKLFSLFFLFIVICVFACNKEIGRSEQDENKPQVSVVMENAPNDVDDDDDGNDDDSTGHPGSNENPPDTSGTGDNENPVATDQGDISQSETNEHAVYSFMGVSGVYFGCSSTFKYEKESLEFILGTSMTSNLTFSRAEFEELIHPGSREFGSLGAFTTYPQRNSDRVEIAYTDKNGRRWCSTRITEKKTGNGVETTVEIDQKKAEFVVDDIHKFEIAAETEGYRINGHFSCTLYEVNGKAKKKIKGDFTGIVAPQ